MKRNGNLEREAFAQLMALPAHCPERQSLKDRVPYSAKKLEQMAKKYGTTTGWHHVPFDWNKTNTEPIYPAWTKKKTQLPVLPFESGKTVLPGLERFAVDNGILQTEN